MSSRVGAVTSLGNVGCGKAAAIASAEGALGAPDAIVSNRQFALGMDGSRVASSGDILIPANTVDVAR